MHIEMKRHEPGHGVAAIGDVMSAVIRTSRPWLHPIVAARRATTPAAMSAAKTGVSDLSLQGFLLSSEVNVTVGTYVSRNC